jgi:2,3-bisphosphoglycerate-dependent phosphoglycerate mutase
MNPDELRELADAEEPRQTAQAQGSLGGVLRPGGADVTELLLIRHGQMPATNDTRTDQPLTEIGLRQADVLGRFLAAGKPLHAIYSSPALRAQQTAEGIARHTGLGVTVIDYLREMDFYLPEGMDLQQLYESAEYKAMNERFQNERRWEVYGDLREHGGTLRKRVTVAIDALLPQHLGERIAVVSHGPTINAYLAEIVESPFDTIASTQLTGITTILAAGDRRRILSVNARPHFGV